MSYAYDAFISFSSTDRPWAMKLYSALKASNIEPFLDQERLEAGRPWAPTLAKAIQTSQHFVVLWSQHAKQSDWVRRELGVFEAIVGSALDSHNGEDRRFIFLMLEGDNQAYTSIQMISDLKEANVYPGGADAVAPGLWQDVVQKVVHAIRANDPSIPLPVAVLAMTKDELLHLDWNKKAVFGPALNTLLHELGIAALEEYYGDQRTAWKPFGGPLNIRQLLDKLLASINNGLTPPFRWEYLDSAFWTDNEVARTQRAKLLSTLSVVIIDPLSLYEQQVYERLVFLSPCFDNEQSIILVLTPTLIPSHFVQLSTLVEQRGSPFFDKYYEPPVPFNVGYATCGVNIGHERDVRRFLRASLGQYLRSKSARGPSEFLKS